MQAIFDSYSSLDVPVVKEASKHNLFLIGGTAIQLWARYYGVKERRTRSINDLDFLIEAGNKRGLEAFKEFLEDSGFVEEGSVSDEDYTLFFKNTHDEVEVDILRTYERITDVAEVKGVKTIDPVKLFIFKLQRLTSGDQTKSVTDIQDLNTLYDVIEKRGNITELEDAISIEVPYCSEEQLNEWLNE